jgi:hypothetical protein
LIIYSKSSYLSKIACLCRWKFVYFLLSLIFFLVVFSLIILSENLGYHICLQIYLYISLIHARGLLLFEKFTFILLWNIWNIALMMEAASTSETSVHFYQTTRLKNPEDSRLEARWILSRVGVSVFPQRHSFLCCGTLYFPHTRSYLRKLINCVFSSTSYWTHVSVVVSVFLLTTAWRSLHQPDRLFLRNLSFSPLTHILLRPNCFDLRVRCSNFYEQEQLRSVISRGECERYNKKRKNGIKMLILNLNWRQF